MAGNRPFTGVGLYKLRRGGKVELPEGLSEYVTWCKRGESHYCLSTGSEQGSLTIFPPGSIEERERLFKEASAEGLRPEDVGSSRIRLLRLLAFSWPVTIGKSGLLTVPMDARRFGILPPNEGDDVAIVGLGGALELWRPDRLQEEMQREAGQRGELLQSTGLTDEI
jgi:hypothetical protein